MQATDESRPILQFGRFQMRPHRRELLVDGVAVRLGDRAFDILLTLIEARGELVTKDQLMRRVWPDMVVEDINLSVQISALRKALDTDRDLLKTISGRGYRFVAEVSSIAGDSDASGIGRTTPTEPVAVRTNLPMQASALIGRDAEIEEVLGLVADRRLVTLTGAGGIGKTRLGVEVARQLLPRFADGVWLAELAPLSDPELVPVTVASALGLNMASGSLSPEQIAAVLGTRKLLLVLDNCEHVIEAAAHMVDALLRASPMICVMTTSREPLRAEGECVYQVPPLAVPEEGAEAGDDVLNHGAVKLFIARARAAEVQFSADRRIAAIVAICRHLDGIPLAIELAAARAIALGVEGLAARLDDRFRVLTGGHRTALPRHQTLRATLDWSHELLPTKERVVLRRLAVFASAFSLESASAVVTGGDISAADVVDYLVNLVAKSLVTADVRGPAAQYRLLETTRAYALEKLAEGGEIAQFARRHAEYYRDVFEKAEAEWETLPTGEWMAAYGHQIDNVRAALDWAFAPEGDTSIGVTLSAAAVPLWMQLSLMEECRRRVQYALDALGTETLTSRMSMQLHAALGLALMYTRGAEEETRRALASALGVAEHLGDTDYQLRSLWGLCVVCLNNGMFREALGFAKQFCRVAADSPDPVDTPIGDRMMALSLFFLGNLADARKHFERMLSLYVAPVRRSHIIRFQFDQRITANIALAEVLWVLGLPEQAIHAIRRYVDEAVASRHAVTLCNAMAKAFPVAFTAGELELAQRIVNLLLDHAGRNALASWQAEGRCYRSLLLIRGGDVANGVQQLRATLEQLPGMHFSLRYTALQGELACALGSAGAVDQGLAVIEAALARSDRNDERWCVAELLRINGELVLLKDGPDAVSRAQELFLQGLEYARLQNALSWELRCATSMARLLMRQECADEARTLLASVYGRFAEGFSTPDLQAAKSLLEAA